MDETVYQCPECNFNADNLVELDSHITSNLILKFLFEFNLVLKQRNI